jgi:hypothetical protein
MMSSENDLALCSTVSSFVGVTLDWERRTVRDSSSPFPIQNHKPYSRDTANWRSLRPHHRAIIRCFFFPKNGTAVIIVVFAFASSRMTSQPEDDRGLIPRIHVELTFFTPAELTTVYLKGHFWERSSENDLALCSTSGYHNIGLGKENCSWIVLSSKSLPSSSDNSLVFFEHCVNIARDSSQQNKALNFS